MNSNNKGKLRVIIAGSRGFNDYDLLKKECDAFFVDKREIYNIVIISGGARGADKTGEKYAQDEGFALEVYPAQWKKLGKQAGYRRNEQMAEVADALIAFWDGESKGTKHMIDIMNNKGLPTKVVNYDTTN